MSTRDPLPTALSEVVGGPPGVHALRPQRYVVPGALACFTGCFCAAMLVARVTGTALDAVLVQAPLLACAGLAATWLIASVVPGRPQAAFVMAFSPVLLAVGYAGHALAVALVIAAVLAAGTRLRLSGRAEMFAGMALGAVLAVGWTWRRAPHGWSALVHGRGGDGTLWYVVRQLGGGASAGFLTLLGVLVVVAALGGVLLLDAAGTRPSMAHAALLVLAPTMLLGRWYRPSDALWLLPLAAVAGLRWRELLGWQLLACFGWATTLALHHQFDHTSVLEASTGGTPFYTWSVLIRAAGVVWLIVAVLVAVLDRVEPRRAAHRG